ncbi:MAG: ABC transporter permease [Cyanobacteria bacterium P01_H01_bin.121]
MQLSALRHWSLGILANGTTTYVLKRVLQAGLTLFLASALCFFIVQLTPGDYLDTLRQNPQISPERIEELRQQFGLDQPAWRQYLNWLWQIVRPRWQAWGPLGFWIPNLNFGNSFVYNRTVGSLILERMVATLLLTIAAIVLTWAIAIPLGVIAAVNQNRWLDRLLRVLSYIGQGFPSLVTALLLLILAQNVSPLLPVGDMTSLDFAEFSWPGQLLDLGWHLFLPALALSITGFAGLQRITRGEMLDVLRQDYIRTARAKGLPEQRVIYGHALRNAINPLITILGFEFSTLLSGAFVTEFFFNWPGLGRLILQAVLAKDLYLVMASLMMGATMLVLGNLLADLLLKFSDPRIQLS